ncbi:MAG: type II toxin-antitoxin system RelE/ParE family toxin [Elusimicrobia bacterium]|nr:type II toxin-antitoxin system RelE/ParE family toxin [Elusimicrobiota bacterium]
MNVELLPQAAGDFQAIAEPLHGRVLKRLEVLGDFPELGSPLNRAFTGYRSTIVELFRIVYRLRTDGVVEITFIRDCRRRLPKRP